MTDIASALYAARIAVPPAEARLLLRHVLKTTAEEVSAHPERALAPDESDRFRALVARRAAGEPIAHLVGMREFHGLAFRVTPDVLIPRPETELLVEVALETGRAGRILDLGTGSGCVAITLAKLCPEVHVTAVDASEAALEVARANAQAHGVSVRFLRGDWFSDLGGEYFDLILANPPYVAENDPHLSEGDLRFEPRAALVSGPDGLDAIRRIVAGAPDHLAPDGRLFIEHGYDQAGAVARLLDDAGFGSLEAHRDLAGIIRVTGGQRPAN